MIYIKKLEIKKIKNNKYFIIFKYLFLGLINSLF